MPPVAQPAAVPGGNQSQVGDTLLTTDPFKMRQLNLDEHERLIISDIQKHFYDGQYNRAEVICGEMIFRAGDQHKPVFAMLLAEVFWMQKKTRDAEQVFTNIRSLKLPPEAKQKIETAIERIKKHSVD